MPKPSKRLPAGTPIRVFKLAKVTTEKRAGLADRRVAERRKEDRRITVTRAGGLSFRPITEADLDRPTNNPTGRNLTLRKMVEKTRELFEQEVTNLRLDSKLDRAAAIERLLRPQTRNNYHTGNGLFIRTNYFDYRTNSDHQFPIWVAYNPLENQFYYSVNRRFGERRTKQRRTPQEKIRVEKVTRKIKQ